jgi:chromosome segregation ATPase
MKETEKSRDFTAEINAAQFAANKLKERLLELPSELQESRKELLNCECSTQIQAVFERIAQLETEERNTRILERRAELKLLETTAQAEAATAEETRQAFENALAELPDRQVAFDEAKAALDELTARIHRSEGRAVDAERSARRAEQTLTELQNAPLEF